jgi:hypothetical protein
VNEWRSFTVTCIERPPLWTTSIVPKDSARCAAVIAAQLRAAPPAQLASYINATTVLVDLGVIMAREDGWPDFHALRRGQ